MAAPSTPTSKQVAASLPRTEPTAVTRSSSFSSTVTAVFPAASDAEPMMCEQMIALSSAPMPAAAPSPAAARRASVGRTIAKSAKKAAKPAQNAGTRFNKIRLKVKGLAPAAAKPATPVAAASLFQRSDYLVHSTEANGDCGYTAVAQGMVLGRVEPTTVEGRRIWGLIASRPAEKRGASLRAELAKLVNDPARRALVAFGMEQVTVDKAYVRMLTGLHQPTDDEGFPNPDGYAEAAELRMAARLFGVTLGVYNENSEHSARLEGRPLAMWEIIDGASAVELDLLEESNMDEVARRCAGRFVPLVQRAGAAHFDALYKKARGAARRCCQRDAVSEAAGVVY